MGEERRRNKLHDETVKTCINEWSYIARSAGPVFGKERSLPDPLECFPKSPGPTYGIVLLCVCVCSVTLLWLTVVFTLTPNCSAS